MNNWRRNYFVIALYCDFPIIEAMFINNEDYTLQLCVFETVSKKYKSELPKKNRIVVYTSKVNIFFTIENDNDLRQTRVNYEKQFLRERMSFFGARVYTGQVANRIISSQSFLLGQIE